MAKTFPFDLIYSFNFARKSGSSTLRSSLPEAATSHAALLAQAACCFTYEQRPPRPPPPCLRLAASDWSTLHKPVCRHVHEAIFSTLSTIIMNLCKMCEFMH